MIITEQMLSELRADVAGRMSEKRFAHTYEVEQMIVRLGELYLPEQIPMLRAAALLHDLTKELSIEEQVAILRAHGKSVTEFDRHAPKTLHARTAALLIPEQFPAFADPELLFCVRFHTTGRTGMSLAAKLLYLADYIDMSRTFSDCVTLREFFFSAEPEKMTMSDRLDHLRETLILSFDMTMRALIEDGKPLSVDTAHARNELICERRK